MAQILRNCFQCAAHLRLGSCAARVGTRAALTAAEVGCKCATDVGGLAPRIDENENVVGAWQSPASPMPTMFADVSKHTAQQYSGSMRLRMREARQMEWWRDERNL